eukprot:CAMPEP_0172439718 /NCGR_PEP_ID=MMETSP1065-20121228/609_1 /TAXON_ID=265537 /ORGANISM="Amphiprora paludosa, Strain CCMP125" /LENGTH=188 /DNA_ID=CAMNT_0013188437 /DNA_START=75 /DNA_END=641 /DNA_ORIENTATION=+
MTDKATGIAFPPTRNDLEVFGVGVRKKGPIKIYSVACYCQAALKEKLAAISRGGAKQEALRTLQSGAKEGPTSFLLEMAFKVGAEKMASAIADSVAPRHGGSANDVDSLKGLILGGVSANCKGGAAVKGTQLEFLCSPESGVGVSVNGQSQGSVESPDLAKAFCDVYLDSKCVSPQLVESCLETNCAP